MTVAGILRFIGFTWGLPYFENSDEPWFFYEAAFQRGLLNSWLHPNPSPGLIGIYKVLQIGAEWVTGRSSLLYTAEITTALRFISVLVSLLTLVCIALCARTLGGKRAGWLAAALWAINPLVIYHSFIAIAEPWMMLFAALALYLAAATVRYERGFAPLLSVWAGLAAFSFKYSMFSFAGIGLAAALWRLWSQWSADPSGARRGYWLRIIGLQVASIIGFLAFMVLFGGLIHDINNPSREVAQFVQNPLARAGDPQVIGQVVNAGFRQLGTTPLIFITLYALVMLLIVRGSQPLPIRRNALLAAWLGFGALGLFNMLLIPFYLLYEGTLLRYLFSADLTFVILAAVGLGILYNAFEKRIRHQRNSLLTIAALLGIAVWISPLAMQSIHEAADRVKPYTYTDMTVWASSTLAPGGILSDFLGHRAFTREFGGYTGPYRIWSYTLDPLSKSQQAWIRDGYNYMERTADEAQTMQQTAEGKEFFQQILALRQFPPPESKASWLGPTFTVYQLSRPQQSLDYRFGEGIHLIGIDGMRTVAAPGDSLSLVFYWQAAQTPLDNYSLFVHLVPAGDRTRMLTQVDGAPGPTNRPTLTWAVPSEILVSAPFTLSIPTDLLPGQYKLWIGLYNPQTGQRLATDSGTDQLLTQITVAIPF